LAHFKIDPTSLTTPSQVENMTNWYFQDSPWLAGISPHKWAFDKMETIEPGSASKNSSSFTKSISAWMSSSSYQFFFSHYTEVRKRPLAADKISQWLVCCYLSPTVRLIKCLSGFIAEEEKTFPYVLQTLKAFTVHDEDSEFDEVRGFTYRNKLGVPLPGCLCVLGGKRRFGFEIKSALRGNLDITLSYLPFKYLQPLGPNFWNLRTPFKIYGGVLDLGNHMSFIRLKSGRFLVIDAVDPLGDATEGAGGEHLKSEIDRLTEGGRLMEAVVATHPFHTLGFGPFYSVYGGKGEPPKNINTTDSTAAAASPDSSGGGGGGGSSSGVSAYPKWYGTPRHVGRLNTIPWTASVIDCGVMKLWESDGVFMRIPEGAEFNNPKPPTTNHFSNMFVFHEPSR
jgi:hypothetical protein